MSSQKKNTRSWPCRNYIYIYVYIYIFYLFLTKSAGSVEYTDCFSADWQGQDPSNEWSGYDIKQSDGEVSHNAEALENVENSFTAIALRSTLARSGST